MGSDASRAALEFSGGAVAAEELASTFRTNVTIMTCVFLSNFGLSELSSTFRSWVNKCDHYDMCLFIQLDCLDVCPQRPLWMIASLTGKKIQSRSQ